MADDHRDLVAQALAAAKDHEFRLRCTFERDRRAAEDAQVAGARRTVTEDGRGIGADQRGIRRFAGLDLDQQQGRQDERDAGEFERRVPEFGKGCDRRIDTRLDVERQRSDPGRVDVRQGDGTGFARDPVRAAAAAAPAAAAGRVPRRFPRAGPPTAPRAIRHS